MRGSLGCLVFLDENKQIGWWSEMSVKRTTEYRDYVFDLIYILSIRVADWRVILVGLLIIGIIALFKKMFKSFFVYFVLIKF